MFRRQDAVLDGTAHFLHAWVTSLSPHSLTLSRPFPEQGVEGAVPTLKFDYLLYALGSHLPAPIGLWGPVPDESATVPKTAVD